MQRRRMLELSGLAAASRVLGAASEQEKATKRPDPYADAVFKSGPPPMPERGSFCIAVLPDTQNYSERHPDQYFAQTRWIVENRASRNIACVLHLGDITNNNVPREWEVASKAMATFEGHLPYFMAPGNHDYSEGGECTDRTTLLNNYFPVRRIQQQAGFGGVYDKEPDRTENNYHTFSAGGRDFLAIALEFGPRRDVVRWANEVVDRHPRHEAILVTHAFVYYDDRRYDWKKFGTQQKWNPHNYGVARATGDDVADGEELWRDLIAPRKNFILAINGHVLGDGLGRLADKDSAGRTVSQVLVNFQMKPNGGDGWLRMLEFLPDGKTIKAYDYSPTLDRQNLSEQNRFELTVSPAAT